jgi:hypothetical protein
MGADIRGLDLSGVNLRGVSLAGVDLRQVDLQGLLRHRKPAEPEEPTAAPGAEAREPEPPAEEEPFGVDTEEPPAGT